MIYLRGARDLAVWGYIAATIIFGGCTSTAGWCDRQLAPEEFARCRAENQRHGGNCCWSDKVHGHWTHWAPCRDRPAGEPCRPGTGSDL